MPYQLRRWGGVHNEEVDKKAIMVSRPPLLPPPPPPPPTHPPTRKQALKILLFVAIPLVLTSTIFASMYAWIQARQYGYNVEDWQRCLVR